jgi:NAD(P)-dependent dehydrogenase (short-subunit alcohol dehydrogenase family)
MRRPEVNDFSRRADLTGRTALVTGAAGHLGREICDTVADLGAIVAATDTVGQLENGRPIIGASLSVPAELTSTDDIHHLVDHVLAETGGLEILVHSAALVGTDNLSGWAAPFLEQSIGAWRLALEINLTSAFTLCQRAAPALERSGHGSVIFISSIYGFLGQDPRLYEGTDMASPAAYFASKGGLEQLSRWLATTLAPQTRVNTICPGGVERGQSTLFRDRYASKTPLGRLATEKDLRGAIGFLASDLSAYVTGQRLVVDGGLSAN